jgi:hypothetical protein
MANARKKNTIWVDTDGDITVDATKPRLSGILLSPTGTSGGTLVIKETNSSGTVIFKAKLLDDASKYVDLTSELLPKGIELTTTINVDVTTMEAMLYGEWSLKSEV